MALRSPPCPGRVPPPGSPAGGRKQRALGIIRSDTTLSPAETRDRLPRPWCDPGPWAPEQSMSPPILLSFTSGDGESRDSPAAQ